VPVPIRGKAVKLVMLVDSYTTLILAVDSLSHAVLTRFDHGQDACDFIWRTGHVRRKARNTALALVAVGTCPR
jgi:hypothetical protein